MANKRATQPTRSGLLLAPFRRAAAKFAFVDHERRAREEIIAIHGSAIQLIEVRINHVYSLIAALQAELKGLADGIEAVRTELEGGFAARADLTLSELWRRLEYADAHNATAIQRLREDLERLIADGSESRQTRPAITSAASNDVFADDQSAGSGTNPDDSSIAQE